MLDFRRSHQPSSYSSGGQRGRLLFLVLSLGVVMILMDQARRPHTWRWVAALAEHDDAQPAPAQAKTIPPAMGAYFPGVEREQLETVRDDTTFRQTEQPAWFRLLDILNKTDEEVLVRQSLGRVTYSQLFAQSEVYRGRLVTLAGTVRRVHPLTAPQNDGGIERYCQVWLQPTDHPTSPVVVYCLRLPAGFPKGMGLSQPAEITGFFFKRWVYEAQDSLQTAPVVLARTLHWQKLPEAVPQPPGESGTLLPWIGLALVASVLVAVWIYGRTRPVRLEPIEPPRFDGIEEPASAGEPAPEREPETEGL